MKNMNDPFQAFSNNESAGILALIVFHDGIPQ